MTKLQKGIGDSSFFWCALCNRKLIFLGVLVKLVWLGSAVSSEMCR